MSQSANPFAALAIAATALSACSAQTPPMESAPPATKWDSGCGADALGGYVGRKATEKVVAAISAWRGGKPIRVLKPGSMVTMDYRPDRLNVDVDADGTIKGFRCT